MINSGFSISNENDLCKLTSNSLSACQLNAIIPTRSIERRLNSYYCTNYGKNTPECLPPGQEYIPQQNTQPTHKNGDGTYQPMREYPDKTLQLQQQMQEQNNRDMNYLLRETNIKSRK